VVRAHEAGTNQAHSDSRHPILPIHPMAADNTRGAPVT
jgi:hypothetical protein